MLAGLLAWLVVATFGASWSMAVTAGIVFYLLLVIGVATLTDSRNWSLGPSGSSPDTKRTLRSIRVAIFGAVFGLPLVGVVLAERTNDGSIFYFGLVSMAIAVVALNIVRMQVQRSVPPSSPA